MCKNKLFIAALLAALMLVLAACGGAATPTARPTTAATTAPTADAQAAATEEAAAATEAVAEATEAVAAVTEEAAAATEAPAMATEETAATEEAGAMATEEGAGAMAAETTREAAMATEEAVAMATEAPMAATEEAAMSTPEAVAGGATVTVATGGEIVLGLAAALSGEGLAPLGEDIQRGAELALAARPSVTVGGSEFTVSLDAQDDLCSAEGGQAVSTRFTSDANVVGVVGPMCSSACRAAAPIFDTAGYTTISPSCTAPDLTTSGFASFNRSVVSDAFQGVVLADYIFNELGLTQIATIHDGSAYGEGLVNVLTTRFTELGGEVVAADAVNVGDTDFRSLLEEIASAEPQLLFFGGFVAEGVRLAEQRFDAGMDSVVFMGADGLRTPELLESGGANVEGAYVSSAIAASSAALTELETSYAETYGFAPTGPYYSQAYDAVNMFLDAIEATATLDADGNLVIDRAAVSAYVRSIQGFAGISGDLNCDSTGECSAAEIGIYQVQDGEFVPVNAAAIAAAEAAAAAEATPEAAAPTAEPTAEGTPGA